MTTSHVTNLKQRIFYPSLGIILVVVLAILAVVARQENHAFSESVNQKLLDSAASYNRVVNNEAVFYEALLNYITRTSKMTEAWQQQDRKELTLLAEKFFVLIQEQQRASHLHFYNTAGEIFLRISKTKQIRDAYHSTLKQAQATGSPHWGLAINEKGKLILEVVTPWFIGGKLSGYIEIGQDIEQLIAHHSHELPSNFILLQTKSKLEASNWERHNPTQPWATLPDPVIIFSSHIDPPTQLLRTLNAELDSNTTAPVPQRFERNNRSFQLTYLPLDDLQGDGGGKLFLMTDISDATNKRRSTLLLFSSAAAGIFLITLIILYLLTYRIERQLNNTYRQLEKEVEERRIAEQDLSKLKEDLEHRIDSRTHQLQLLNHQLIQDNERHRQTENALSASEERYRTLFDASGEAMVLLEHNHIIECNNAFLTLFGYKFRNQVIGKPSEVLSAPYQSNGEPTDQAVMRIVKKAHDEKNYKTEWLARRYNGTHLPTEVSLTLVKYGERSFTHILFQDITERKKTESKVIQHAYFDSLTGLPNRNLFMDRLNQALEHSKRNNHYGSILFTDLDHFKNVNDSLGHDKGDLLLKEVARRLRKAIRAEDTVARFGGDEFVILLADLGDDHAKTIRGTQKIAEKIIKSFERPFKVKPYEFHLTPSIGASIFSRQSERTEDVLKQADAAMYKAKACGRNTVRFFEQSMQNALEDRISIEKDLRLAFKNDELSLVFQPQINLQQQIVGAETLVRWKNPARGMVSPAEFIPIAEETGLIIELGKWIFNHALDFYQELIKENVAEHFHLSVNVSPLQFRQTDMVNLFSEGLTSRAINPANITLEITESTLMDDISESSAKLQQLKDIGFRISIDDFGTGYSSLAYLKKLDIDELKIDQSFIRDINIDHNDAIIVEAIISMAKHLQLHTIAEGVETKEQLNLLTSQGCQYFQGFHFYKPLDSIELTTLLKQQSATASHTPKE